MSAAAPDIGGAWTVANGRATLAASGLSVPDRAGTLGLTKTSEFSEKGKALDNVAQFESPDGQVFATVYVYRTTYADAALAAYATDRAIRARLGAQVALTQVGAVPFGGQATGAIRQVFTGGMLSGQPTASAAAFARVGGWVVKIRATGPADRAVEVTGALDALIAGAAVGKDVFVYPAAPLQVKAPCPAVDEPSPKLVKRSKDTGANLLSGVFGPGLVSASTAKQADDLAVFPRNGRDPVCVRGTMGVGGMELLQPVGAGQPDVTLIALSDAGQVLAIEKALLGSGYAIKRYAIGRVEIAGTIDRQPTAEHLMTLLSAKDAPEMRISATTTVTAKGDSNTTLNSDLLK